jgi:hypothetical protein
MTPKPKSRFEAELAERASLRVCVRKVLNKDFKRLEGTAASRITPQTAVYKPLFKRNDAILKPF